MKKVAKKPVKKAVKKAVKKVVRKPAKRSTEAAKGKSLVEILQFGGGAVTGYGGGNGAGLANPQTLAIIAAWVFVLLRFVIFYGVFGDE